MKKRSLIHNARILTQADGLVADSMAINGNRIMAVGNNLQHDPDFRSYSRIDVAGNTIVPGLVDAHTHFAYFAITLGQVNLHDLDSIDTCLKKIKSFAGKLSKDDWVVGEGYAPDRWKKRVEPDAATLDLVTGGRPAFLFSKDQHSCWVNSRAMEIAGITKKTRDPAGGKIERDADGTPSGVMREGPAIGLVFKHIPMPSKKEMARRYKMALDHAYRKGVTGVHSFDGPEAMTYYMELAQQGKVGLRVTYYPSADLLPYLLKEKIYYGTGTDFFRIAGIKIFSDGSLGSQTALCFNKYKGTKDNYGIEVRTVPEMKRLITQAAKLNLPAAIHAIGDKAVANVLDAFEAAPRLDFGARHRIEHLQLVRRADLARVKKLGVTASVQPSHCPSDIEMIRNYWGRRGANAYIFRTLIDRKIPLAFGSDAPIEPLDPIAGIAAAVRRARPGKRDVFYPEQRISAAEALYNFTVGPARAVGQEHCRGYVLPGYPADFVVLDRDITRVAPTRLYDTRVLATILDGKVMYADEYSAF
ncbi:amidohydrolase family protein [candidate division GN15 bacterium]|nr:amidohydrolase family protein [candidate division GN15 bacterium]